MYHSLVKRGETLKSAQVEGVKEFYQQTHRTIDVSIHMRGNSFKIPFSSSIKEDFRELDQEEKERNIELLPEEKDFLDFCIHNLDENMDEEDFLHLAKLSVRATLARLTAIRKELAERPLNESTNDDNMKLMICSSLLRKFEEVAQDLEEPPTLPNEARSRRTKVIRTLSLMKETIQTIFTNGANLAALQDEVLQMSNTRTDSRFPLA